MIPKQLGHIWIGPFPPPLEWMETWKQAHPTWEYTLYDNDYLLSRRFICQRQIIEYVKRGQYAGVSDLIRYEILFEKGGFLPEADSLCLNAVDDLFTEEKCYTVYELASADNHMVSPFLASNPGNPVLKKVLETLSTVDPQKLKDPWKSVGNWFLARFILKHKSFPDDLKIFPSHYFIPEHCRGETYEGDDKLYARQMWGTTKKAYPHSNGRHGMSQQELSRRRDLLVEGLQKNLSE